MGMTKHSVMTAVIRFVGVYSLVCAVTLIPIEVMTIQSMVRNKQPDFTPAGIGVGLVLTVCLALLAMRKPQVFAGRRGDDASTPDSPRAALVFETAMLVYAALLAVGGHL